MGGCSARTPLGQRSEPSLEVRRVVSTAAQDRARIKRLAAEKETSTYECGGHERPVSAVKQQPVNTVNTRTAYPGNVVSFPISHFPFPTFPIPMWEIPDLET